MEGKISGVSLPLFVTYSLIQGQFITILRNCFTTEIHKSSGFQSTALLQLLRRVTVSFMHCVYKLAYLLIVFGGVHVSVCVC